MSEELLWKQWEGGRSHENFPGCMQEKHWVFYYTPLHQAGVQSMACDKNSSRYLCQKEKKITASGHLFLLLTGLIARM